MFFNIISASNTLLLILILAFAVFGFSFIKIVSAPKKKLNPLRNNRSLVLYKK